MEGVFVRYRKLALATLIIGQIVIIPTVAMAEGPLTKAITNGWNYVKTREGKCVAVLSAMYIRLKTKGSKWDYKCADWKDDLKALAGCVNIVDPESYKTVAYLFDKWVVGRAFSLLDIKYDEVTKDGVINTVKDKKIASKPFGLLGLFDAYVIIMLKDLIDAGKNIATISDYTALEA